MTFLILTLLAFGFLGAVVASVTDPKPLRRPREWTVGALLDARR